MTLARYIRTLLWTGSFVLVTGFMTTISPSVIAQEGGSNSLTVQITRPIVATVSQGWAYTKPSDPGSADVEFTLTPTGSSCSTTTYTIVMYFNDPHNTHGGGTYSSTSGTISGNNSVLVDQGYSGGNVTITYQINGGAAQTLNFSIIGSNPTTAQVASYETTSSYWFLGQILQQESHLQQYINGWPYVSPNPDGIGIAQDDGQQNDLIDSVYWDWGSNIGEGANIISANGTTAAKFWNQYLSDWAYDYPNFTNGPVATTFPNGCFFAYPSANFPNSHSYYDANLMTGYNGVGGSAYYPPHYFARYTPSTATVAGYWTVQNTVRTYVSDVCSYPVL